MASQDDFVALLPPKPTRPTPPLGDEYVVVSEAVVSEDVVSEAVVSEADAQDEQNSQLQLQVLRPPNPSPHVWPSDSVPLTQGIDVDVVGVVAYELSYSDDRRDCAERLMLMVNPRMAAFTGFSNYKGLFSMSGWHYGPDGGPSWSNAGGRLTLRFNCRGNDVQWRVRVPMESLSEHGVRTPTWACRDQRPIRVRLEVLHYHDGRVLDLRPSYPRGSTTLDELEVFWRARQTPS